MQQGSDYFRTILTAVGALAALKAVLVLLVDEDRLKELTFAVLVALLTIAVLVALAGSILRSRHGDADPVPQWVISVNGWMVFVCCFAIGAWALLVPAWLVAPGWVQILIGGILGLLFVVLIFLQVPLRDQWLQNWLRSLLDKLPSPPWTMVVAAILIAVAVILIVIVGPGRVYGYLRSIISPRPPTVKIVSDLPLGGRSGRQSEEIVNAINLALDNRDYKAGEVNVEYEALDDSTVEAGGWTQVQCLQNALTAAFDEEVVAWIGPFDSGCAQIEIPILNLAGLPMISPGNTHVGLTQEEGGEPDELERYYPTGQRNYTHLAPTDDEQARAGAKLMQDAGVKTVYVLDDRTEYGRRMAAQFVRNAPDFDIKVLGSDNIDPAAANSEMKEIAQKDPAAIYYGGHRRGVVQLIEDKVAAGMSNEDVLFVGSDGIFDDGLLEAGDATEGVYITFGGRNYSATRFGHPQ